MLPIHSIRQQVTRVIAAGGDAVIAAPAGSGKTTQVPRFILEALRSGPRRVLVLQPRRLAARLMAARVAAEMNSRLGDLVGYQTRHDSCVSDRNVIRFMTDGLLPRLLQDDPLLGGVGAVVLDEFHERTVAADLSLALLRRLQQTHRPDLRIVVMSATLDVRPVRDYLKCEVLEAAGRVYPVEVRYCARRTAARSVFDRRIVQPQIWDLAAAAVAQLLSATDDGDVLVFMPGVYEIRRTIEACRRTPGRDDVLLCPLYSELPPEEQDLALAPRPGRKVIVATNVAETSITIEGVRYVVDSGLARVSRYDPGRGINVLAMEPISRASADQRAGRAGRLGPGICVRLWPEDEHRHRPPHLTPEIQRTDLAETVLRLRSLGIDDIGGLDWLEPPPARNVQEAIELLRELGAIGDDGRLTSAGDAMARLPMHPRLARMLVEAARRGCLERAALWAALVSEREITVAGRFNASAVAAGPVKSDFLVLEAAMEAASRVRYDAERCVAMGLNAAACRQVDRTRRLYLAAARSAGLHCARRGKSEHPADIADAAGCLLAAFPDHLAVRRGGSAVCELSGGRRAQIDPQSLVRDEGLLVAVEIQEVVSAGHGAKIVLSLVTAVERGWFDEMLGGRTAARRIVAWNPSTLSVEARRQLMFGDLVISESPGGEPDAALAADMLARQVVAGAIRLEKWDDSVQQWIARVRCVRKWFPERNLIFYDEDEQRLIIAEICLGATRYSQIAQRPCLEHVRAALSPEDQRFVERMAPEFIMLPGGRRMRVTYAENAQPRGRARIQDIYGLKRAPTVAGGKVKVLLEILAPNMRPVQVTDDLENFWKNLYPDIRRQLARRYPKHEWR